MNIAKFLILTIIPLNIFAKTTLPQEMNGTLEVNVDFATGKAIIDSTRNSSMISYWHTFTNDDGLKTVLADHERINADYSATINSHDELILKLSNGDTVNFGELTYKRHAIDNSKAYGTTREVQVKLLNYKIEKTLLPTYAYGSWGPILGASLERRVAKIAATLEFIGNGDNRLCYSYVVKNPFVIYEDKPLSLRDYEFKVVRLTKGSCSSK